MASLLHLSDLHLGTGGDEHFGDHKVEVISPGERESRSRMLKSSLLNLGNALRANDEQLDAIVVSGDITYQAASDGLGLLGDMLAALGDRVPEPGRIVVVPGNHDVAWMTAAGSPERYKSFVDQVRSVGYVTPALEGIDAEPTDDKQGVLTASDGSFVIVALNSADHCGVQQMVTKPEQLDAMAAVEASGDASALDLLKMFKSATLYDVARVGALQRGHGSRALAAELGRLASMPDVQPVRIATFHHQLLPISLDEEVKPFEALTNLAQVRDWVAANEIELLLHGHKHVAHAYEDYYVPLDAPGSRNPRRLLVSSVGTVGLGQQSQNTLARLIRVDPTRSRLGRIDLVDVPATRPGIPFELDSLNRNRHLLRVNQGTSAEISSATVADVHEQILERIEAGVELPAPLVCRVSNPASADVAPRTLRSLVPGDDAEVDAWFKDTVQVWQNERSYSAMAFNHGERILRFNDETDLVERVAQVLTSERSTSRGVISLLDQSHDDVTSDGQFPAFCLVQLFIKSGKLVVVGYFRKQEMKYWWPVNVAELAYLQRIVRDKLSARDSQHVPQLGEIVTVTAIPADGDAIPRVVVPKLDRWVDDDPARLTRMCMALMAPERVNVGSAHDDWVTMLNECGPVVAAAADGSPVPIAGMGALLEEFSTLERVLDAPDFDLGPVTTAIEALRSQHASYQQVTRRDGRDQTQEARLKVTHESLKTALDERLPAPETESVPAPTTG